MEWSDGRLINYPPLEQLNPGVRFEHAGFRHAVVIGNAEAMLSLDLHADENIKSSERRQQHSHGLELALEGVEHQSKTFESGYPKQGLIPLLSKDHWSRATMPVELEVGVTHLAPN